MDNTTLAKQTLVLIMVALQQIICNAQPERDSTVLDSTIVLRSKNMEVKLSKKTFFEIGLGTKFSTTKVYSYVGEALDDDNYIKRTRTLLNASVGATIAIWNIDPMWYLSLVPSVNLEAYLKTDYSYASLADDNTGLYGGVNVPILTTITYGAIGRSKKTWGVSFGIGALTGFSTYLNDELHIVPLTSFEVMYVPNKTMIKIKVLAEVFSNFTEKGVSHKSVSVLLCLGL